MIGLADAVTYLFADYAKTVCAGIVTLSAISVIFRILWEFR